MKPTCKNKVEGCKIDKAVPKQFSVAASLAWTRGRVGIKCRKVMKSLECRTDAGLGLKSIGHGEMCQGSRAGKYRIKVMF